MAKKITKKKHSFSVLKQCLLVSISLGCGYLISVMYDYKQLNDWFTLSSKSFVANNEIKNPQPKLEFYTLLAESTAPESTQSKIDKIDKIDKIEKAEKPQVVMPRDGYLLQLASFQRREDAERLKAALMMNGFDVQIHTAVQHNVTWHRVVLGPFATRIDAQQMQSSVSQRQRITGIIRKLDV